MSEDFDSVAERLELPERFDADRVDIVQGSDHRRTYTTRWRRQAQAEVYPDHRYHLMPYAWDPPGELVEYVRARVDVDPDQISYQHRASALIEEVDWMSRTDDQRPGGS